MKLYSIQRTFVLGVVTALVVAVGGSSVLAGGGLRMRTRLAGARIGALVPSGNADYRAEPGRSEFKAQVEDLDLPAGTVLTVLVDGAPAGTITLDAFHFGELDLTSRDGDAVPAAHAGSAVVVTDGSGVTLVAGAF
jgi:hypothetical protein